MRSFLQALLVLAATPASVDLAAGRAAPIITVLDTLQSLLAMEAVRRSIATARTVVPQDLR